MLYLLFHFLSQEGTAWKKNKKERKKETSPLTAERVTKQLWLNEATPGSGAQCQSSVFYSVAIISGAQRKYFICSYIIIYFFFVILPREKKSVKQKSISTSVERYFLSIVPAKEINRKIKP